jgi:hypothetical protein
MGGEGGARCLGRVGSRGRWGETYGGGVLECERGENYI